MFLNAIMLAGIGGAAVPLVLHLLSRARFRSVEWGAMMFLEGTNAGERQNAKLKQWILLAMRMGMVGLLAVALARPVVKGYWGGMVREGRVAAVIVLDRSRSMGCEENGRSRMELARTAAIQILSNLRNGDQAALVTMGDGGVDTEVRLTPDLQGVAHRVAELNAGSGQAGVAEGLAEAAGILDRAEPLNREIYVICDRQAGNWGGVKGAFESGWKGRWKEGGMRPRLFVIPVGSEEAGNVAIEGMELLNPPAIEGQTSEVEIRIRNYGLAAWSAMPVKVTAAWGEVFKGTANLGPNALTTVKATVKFPKKGSQVLKAQIESPGLRGDDEFQYAVEVRRPLEVLIISGDERGGAFRKESDFIHLALAPHEMGKRAGNDPAKVKVATVAQWSELNPKVQSVVVLANVTQLNLAQVRELEQYVYGGGGLLISLGSLVRADQYNELFYRNGTGFLPALLNAPTAADGSAATTLLGLELGHPIFRFLKGKPDPLPSATVGRYFPAVARKPDARVLASYGSGQPFLIEAGLGRGRVLLVTTSLDIDWNTLPLSGFYLPFVQSAVQYLAAGTMVDRNLLPGQLIGATVAQLEEKKKPSITLPDGTEDAVEVYQYNDHAEVSYGKTERAGRYVLHLSKGVNVDFVVQSPVAESDLRALSKGEWEEMGKGLGFELIEGNRRAIANVVGGERAGQEIWGVLIGAVLLLGAGEMVMAWVWEREEKAGH